MSNATNGVQQEAFSEEAMHSAYTAYKQQIYYFILSRVRHTETAEDITSAVFVRCFQYLKDRSSQPHHLRGLLYTIARSQIADFFKSIKHDSGIDIDEIDVVDEQRTDVIEQIDTSMSIDEIRRCMEMLPASHQEILHLRYIDELEYEEISKILGKSEGSIRVMIHRIIHDMRRKIS